MNFFFLLLLSTNTWALSKKRNVIDCKEKALGPCSEFPGRARLYNNRDVRVWKKGTNRLYEITSQTASALNEIKHLSMGTEINAIFEVCLIKPEAPTGIIDMCVQAVKNIKTTHMPE